MARRVLYCLCMTKFKFYGTLANGQCGMVVAIELPDIQAAYRILKAHSNLKSFVAVR